MRTLKLLPPFLLLILLFSSSASAQQIVLSQSNVTGIYAPGEQVKVTATLEGIMSDSVTVTTRLNYGSEITSRKIAMPAGGLTIFDESFTGPASVILEVRTGDYFASTGLVVDPGSFEPGTERPADFDSYWKKEKKALRQLPMEVQSWPVPLTDEGYTCSNIEINCTSEAPVRGYLALPKDSKSKSLPIVLFVHAAGVKGSWCLSQPSNALNYARMGNGAIAFDLNAHGMLNGQPQEYYDQLEKGELKNYYHQGLENREENYFRGMYLRLIRTLDFLTSQPEWDGKRILVIGESQGGGQALAAAGLDKRVTVAVATVPAMCDWGGPLVGRTGGWPDPLNTTYDRQKMLSTLPYFDAAHLLKNSKATLVTEIGFIDVTCSSISIYAAINQSKGEKITFGVPYRGHHVNQRSFQKTWEETVYQPKMEFIEQYLK